MSSTVCVEDTDFLEQSRRHNDIWREWLAARLTELGLTVYPSIANFLLVSFANASSDGNQAAEAARQFLKARGILVRQMGGYGLPYCLRISIGTEDEMRAVADAVAAFLKG
jgi:histidinol-phosphate aminotransferase